MINLMIDSHAHLGLLSENPGALINLVKELVTFTNPAYPMPIFFIQPSEPEH